MNNTATNFKNQGHLSNGPLRLISGNNPGLHPQDGRPDKHALPLHQLQRHAQDWLFEGEYSNQSQRTIGEKRAVINKLLWFLNQRGYEQCGVSEIRQFLAYLRNGHLEAGGRWGNPRMTKPLRPTSILNHYVYIQGLHSWMKQQGFIEATPFDAIKRPQLPREQVQPFTQEQVAMLLRATRSMLHPKRDEAIIWLLVDTGVRASELCGLKIRDIDIQGRSVNVLGKGNKYRKVYFGRQCWRAVSLYLRESYHSEDEPLFVSDGGTRRGEALTRSGLLQLMERLGKVAGLKGVRCSPHTFRHTFAVEFLRNGGNVFSLQQMLGHTALQQTTRYVSLAQGDIEHQHRQFSPADRIKV